jgi:hypothetical protein
VLRERVAVLRDRVPLPRDLAPAPAADFAGERVAVEVFAAPFDRFAPVLEDFARLVLDLRAPELVDFARDVEDLDRAPADLRPPAPREELEAEPLPPLDDSSDDHLPDSTRCAASATASAISEPSLVALDITLVAA